MYKTDINCMPSSKLRQVEIAPQLEVKEAFHDDRLEIYRGRHQIYAEEIGQHPINPEQSLKDSLDSFNHYIVVKDRGVLKGFISITPPEKNSFSVDKYFPRHSIPVEFNEFLYEVRLLTVLPSYRESVVSAALMFAAFRWVQEQGGKCIVAIGRGELKSLYEKIGFYFCGHEIKSGEVSYELMTMNVEEQQANLDVHDDLIDRIASRVKWGFNFPIRKKKSHHMDLIQSEESSCFHGGAFFDGIGEGFEDLNRRHQIINADVLDAWFPPTPKAVKKLSTHMPWLMRTSPPIHSDGLLRTLSKVKRIPENNLLLSSGSSSLIFMVFLRLFNKNSKVLLPEPTYGEYAHVLENVIGCTIDRWNLSKEKDFLIDPEECIQKVKDNHYDGLILVNPNNPTGQYHSRSQLHYILDHIPSTTKVWVDEAYIDYLDANHSLERDTKLYSNLIVCKSLSKAYALSGMRISYLCADESNIKTWKCYLPPWAIGLMSQVAATEALKDSEYYQAMYKLTDGLRIEMVSRIKQSFPNWKIYPSYANYLLCELPTTGPSASEWIEHAKTSHVYLRDPGKTSKCLGSHFIRFAIKPSKDQELIIKALEKPFESS